MKIIDIGFYFDGSILFKTDKGEFCFDKKTVIITDGLFDGYPKPDGSNRIKNFSIMKEIIEALKEEINYICPYCKKKLRTTVFTELSEKIIEDYENAMNNLKIKTIEK